MLVLLAFGAALQALWIVENKRTIGEIVDEHLSMSSEPITMPNTLNHEMYMKHYEKWKSYVNALTPLFL